MNYVLLVNSLVVVLLVMSSQLFLLTPITSLTFVKVINDNAKNVVIIVNIVNFNIKIETFFFGKFPIIYTLSLPFPLCDWKKAKMPESDILVHSIFYFASLISVLHLYGWFHVFIFGFCWVFPSEKSKGFLFLMSKWANYDIKTIYGLRILFDVSILHFKRRNIL